RRGRSALPWSFARTRRWRRRRASLTVRLGTLADLPAHVLALVADALALVRLGRAHLADLRGRLGVPLPVRSLYGDLRRSRHLERDAGARLDRDGVGIADVELEVGALERRAVANALDLELLLEALGDALDHVRDQRARQAVQRTILPALGRPRDRDHAV